MWSVDAELESSPSNLGRSHSPVIAVRSQPPLSPLAFHATVTKKLSPFEGDHSYPVQQPFQQSDLISSSLLSPLSFPERFNDKLRFCAGFERSCVTNTSENHLPDEDEVLSPLDWGSRRNSLLASPFSEDSDSDDGLAPSPFSSPGSSSQPDDDDEDGHYHRSLYSPTPHHRYHDLDQYPLGLYHNRTDDDGDLHSLTSFSSPTWSLPSFSSPPSPIASDLPHNQLLKTPSPPLASFGISELGLQSPSLPSTPLPSVSLYDPFSDSFSLTIPCSPRNRALDLPPLETETDSKPNTGLGLTQSSYTSSYAPTGHEIGGQDVFGISERSTWLSLPGADTDDDLIRADLASKNYIPDPGLAISTTPLSRSLLIWDPSTRSGLPANLPTFDGTSSANKFDAVDLLGRPPSPDDDFDVDPVLLAELAEKDTEKWMEIQKLCELKQRTTMAAVLAGSRSWRDREGAQMEAERVKERWREVTALLRLKMPLAETKVKESDGPSGGAEKGSNASAPVGQWPSSAAGSFDPSFAPALLPSGLTLASEESPVTGGSNFSPAPSSIPIVSNGDSPPKPSTSVSGLNETISAPAARVIQRRTSKPKITSMDQLVANMVLHRQQEAIRRSPVRSRTWSPVSCSTHSVAPTRKKSWIQTSPTSPLRQMTLPEELDGATDGVDPTDAKDVASDSPLQLSPLCLTLCGSPESFYAQLERPNPLFFQGL